MSSFPRKIWISTAVMLLVVFLVLGVIYRPGESDTIRVTVNMRPVTEGQIRERVREISERTKATEVDREVAIESLIDDRAVEDHATRLSIPATSVFSFLSRLDTISVSEQFRDRHKKALLESLNRYPTEDDFRLKLKAEVRARYISHLRERATIVRRRAL